MSRRHSGHSAKRGDKKQTQMIATSLSDAPPPRLVESNGTTNNWSSGILGKRLYLLSRHYVCNWFFDAVISV